RLRAAATRGPAARRCRNGWSGRPATASTPRPRCGSSSAGIRCGRRRPRGGAMSLHDEGFSVLLPDAQQWRESSVMKIPNADLLKDLGGSQHLGGRLWRLPPYSANTWHRHAESWELHFLLEGAGRMRIGRKTVTVSRYGSILVAPRKLRQIFNDSAD